MSEFFILNEIDRPCEKLLCFERNGQLFYINNDLPKHAYPMDNRVRNLRDFGFDIEWKNGMFFCKQVRPSTVHYSDGSVRKWQGKDQFSFRL